MQVKMSRLDTFMNNYRKDLKLGAIFMDIQGHEYDFFLGAKDVIIKTQIPTVTEFWPYGLARAEVKRDEYCELLTIWKISALWSIFKPSKTQPRSSSIISAI